MQSKNVDMHWQEPMEDIEAFMSYSFEVMRGRGDFNIYALNVLMH